MIYINQEFDKIYKDNYTLVFRFLLSKTHNRSVSEELAAETFCLALNSYKRYDGSCKISVWLCQIAKHLLYQHYAKHNICDYQYDEKVVEIAVSSAEDESISRARVQALFDSISRLGEPAREIVILRTRDGMSFRNIGTLYNKSETWARVTFFRAKQKLSKEDMEWK